MLFKKKKTHAEEAALFVALALSPGIASASCLVMGTCVTTVVNCYPNAFNVNVCYTTTFVYPCCQDFKVPL